MNQFVRIENVNIKRIIVDTSAPRGGCSLVGNAAATIDLYHFLRQWYIINSKNKLCDIIRRLRAPETTGRPLSDVM